MAGRIGKGMWVAIGAVLLLAILVLAWIDGGERVRRRREGVLQ